RPRTDQRHQQHQTAALVESRRPTQKKQPQKAVRQHTWLPVVSGIVAIGKYSQKQIDQLQRFNKPIVVIDYDELSNGCDSVLPDFDGGIKQAADFLAARYAKIGMIAGQEKTTDQKPVSDSRRDTFAKTLKAKNLYQSEWFMMGDYSEKSG
ncbi:hypothetical protein NE613_15495, partial [Mordavella massiliensis]|nr:hypothetical protein [Mordavella massiliensis]